MGLKFWKKEEQYTENGVPYVVKGDVIIYGKRHRSSRVGNHSSSGLANADGSRLALKFGAGCILAAVSAGAVDVGKILFGSDPVMCGVYAAAFATFCASMVTLDGGSWRSAAKAWAFSFVSGLALSSFTSPAFYGVVGAMGVPAFFYGATRIR